MKTFLLIIITTLCLALAFGQQSAPAGFTIKHAEFFKVGGTPKIPTTWRLIAVTNEFGDPNGFILWFQAPDGSVYLVKAYDHLDGPLTIGTELTKLDSTTNGMTAIK